MIKRPNALLALLALALLLPAAWAQRIPLRILETSDIHMNLLAWDYYQDKPVDDFGLARTATLIRAARAEARNTLLFDNGDLLQGSPLGDTVAHAAPRDDRAVHPAYRVLNALNYDAGNIGNHEFNYGLPFLRRALRGAAFPVLNANLVEDDGRGKPDEAAPAFTPYVILERTFTDDAGATHKLKIGVVGFAPPQVLQWDRQNLAGQLQARDIPATARELVPRMRAAGADLVVVIAHSGFERGSSTAPLAENTVARLAEVPGVDAVLFGHSHGEFPGRYFAQYPGVDLAAGTINGVPATMPGFWGSHLGVIDLVLERGDKGWRVASSHAELRAVYDRATKKVLAAPDPAIDALVRTEHQATLTAMRAEVATSATPIHSYFAQVADDPSVQVVADAQLAWGRKALAGTPYAQLPLLSAAAPFKSGGRGGAANYTDIAAGPIVMRNVADLYVYPNTANIVRVSGAQLREWLEFAAGAFNRIDPRGPAEQDLLNPGYPSYNFDTIDGVSYRIDVTQPARYERGGKLVAPDAHRIVDLKWNGKAVDDAANFAVVTNNYRASGGGNFPGLDGSNIIVAGPDESRAVVQQYLQANGRIDALADGNWQLLPVPGVRLRFVAGNGALSHLAAYPQVKLLKDNGDGTSTFELKP